MKTLSILLTATILLISCSSNNQEDNHTDEASHKWKTHDYNGKIHTVTNIIYDSVIFENGELTILDSNYHSKDKSTFNEDGWNVKAIGYSRDSPRPTIINLKPNVDFNAHTAEIKFYKGGILTQIISVEKKGKLTTKKYTDTLGNLKTKMISEHDADRRLLYLERIHYYADEPLAHIKNRYTYDTDMRIVKSIDVLENTNSTTKIYTLKKDEYGNPLVEYSDGESFKFASIYEYTYYD